MQAASSFHLMWDLFCKYILNRNVFLEILKIKSSTPLDKYLLDINTKLVLKMGDYVYKTVCQFLGLGFVCYWVCQFFGWWLCLSVGLSVSWELCLVLGLSVSWELCLSVGLSVSGELCLVLGLCVCGLVSM